MALKRGLGKGLDSLIPTNVMMESEVKHATVSTASSAEEGKDGTLMVKLSKVEPNREQPRKNFDEDSLQELAESLKQFGMLQPILVQNRGDYYEIIAGERRWRAAKIAGLKEVPVIVRELTDQEIVEISLIENIQREDLNPIEEAQAYKRLLTEFHLKQDEVAERVSKSRTAVTNSMRLLKLCDEVQKMVKDLHKPPKPPKEENKTLQAIYQEISERLKQSLSTKVSVSAKQNGAGKIEIEFYNHEDLERLLERITG